MPDEVTLSTPNYFYGDAGSKEGASAKEWFDAIESRKGSFDTERQFFHWVVRQTRGAGYTWFKSCLQEIWGEKYEDNIADWSMVSQEFRRRFKINSDAHRPDWAHKFSNPKNRTLNEYLGEILEMMQEVQANVQRKADILEKLYTPTQDTVVPTTFAELRGRLEGGAVIDAAFLNQVEGRSKETSKTQMKQEASNALTFAFKVQRESTVREVCPDFIKNKILKREIRREAAKGFTHLDMSAWLSKLATLEEEFGSNTKGPQNGFSKGNGKNKGGKAHEVQSADGDGDDPEVEAVGGQKKRDANKTPGTGKKCTFCKRKGHLISECWKRKATGASAVSSDTPAQPNGETKTLNKEVTAVSGSQLSGNAQGHW